MATLSISRVGTELLDDPTAHPDRVAESLRNIARSNRWFGALAALRHGLRRTLGALPAGTTVTLLDVGTGSGDVPRAAVEWGSRRGIRVVPLGLERSKIAARLALAQGLPMAVGCAGMPPIGDKSVDLVLVSSVAHHFEPDSVVELLRTCNRLARLGVVILDLRRSALGPVAFWFGARLLRFDAVTVHDGMTSIRRGYTRSELTGLLSRAGVRGRVARRPGYRLVATWQPEPT